MSGFQHECMPVHVSNVEETGTNNGRFPSGELSIADNAIGSGLKTRKQHVASLRVLCQIRHLFVRPNSQWC